MKQQIKRYAALAGAVLALSFLAGCGASVPTMEESPEELAAKQFNAPDEGKAGVYIYRRDGFVGRALYKDVYIDGICIGETAPGVFFYTQVEGNQEHVISTESEFSPNSLKFFAKPGELYFFNQYIKWGVFVGGANIERVTEGTGKADVTILKMAVQGTCNSTGPTAEALQEAEY